MLIMKLGKEKHLKVGADGEEIALEYLQKKGFSLVEKNYRKPWGELDIVAKKGDCLHFVEVKTLEVDPEYGRRVSRITSDPFEPLKNMHREKQARLGRIIETYLLSNNLDGEDVDWQIDVVAIVLEEGSGRVLSIEMLEDVILS